ncbi:hypothetical protein Tco_1094141 [Tanacetum coccineum]|uniref:Uncharacterized protein n=1 Tax=Tanacetum coccineum TaxID=301880 RepID=A0ABQ5IEQ9_9ASTR
MVFYQMDTKEVRDRFVAPCFVNRLEAYDGEINLGVEENMISNEYAVKLCLEHEVKRGNKVVKKELIVALRGEIYFVKFIINPEEDNVEPGVIFDDIPLLGEKGLPPFVRKMGKSSRNKKRAMENLNFFYQDIETSSLVGGHLTQEEAAKEAIAIRMIWKDKVELDGKIVKEEEEAVKRIKGEALKEKEDHGAFIFPIRVEGQVGVTTLIAKFLILDILIDRDSPIVIGRGFLRTIGGIVNAPERLFSTFDGFCHQTFRAARSDFMRNAKSDSDDEEDYQIKRNKFGEPIYGPKPAPYLNCNDPDERSLAIQTTYGTHDDEAGSLRSKRPRQHETVEELLLPQVHHEFLLWEGCSRDAKSRLREAGSGEEIFALFDEVCADDELQLKKIIKFRLGGRAHNLTLLEFARRLRLYQAVELEEEGFNVYFEEGLRNDDNFNAQEYWFSISREDNLGLSRSHTSTIRNPILRVIHKMITYGLCQRTTGLGDCKMDEEKWNRDSKRESNLMWSIYLKACYEMQGVDRGCSKEFEYSNLLASMQDLYGRMEIRQEAIERMKYRQSYHWDRYQGVFEHMAGVYSVPTPPPPQYQHQ